MLCDLSPEEIREYRGTLTEPGKNSPYRDRSVEEDKAENPEKMIDQYMRNLEDDLGKVKAETASVMAEEARAKRAYDEALAEVEATRSSR